MKKIGLLLFLFIIIIPFSLNAFCIYNHTDTTIHVKQIYGGKGWPYRFKADLDPGEKACCNWKNKDCNTGGHRDSVVGFKIDGDYVSPLKIFICKIKIKADGDVIVKGSYYKYSCQGQ